MESHRRKANQHIAVPDRTAIDDFGAVDNSYDEPGDVVVSVGVEPRHLRRFAAKQGASGVLAGAGDAFDHGNNHVGIELAGRHVVHEKQGACALHKNVVDAVVHQIAADGVVTIHHHRHLQFRADAVGARYQHRFAHALEVTGKHSTETADIG